MAIDCTLSIRDESGTYYINAYITLVSVFENTREKVRVHIMHDGTITDTGHKNLTDLCSRYGQEIYFHRVPDLAPEAARTIQQWFNLGCMYRYYAAEFIPADKVVYLDCDVIVNRDLKELYNIELGRSLVAAVLDFTNYWSKNGTVRKKYRKKVEFLKLSKEDCFNSGVMLMNLEKFRELNKDGNILVSRTLQALESGIVLDNPDQDILNALCTNLPDGLLRLDDSFNYMMVRAGRLYDGPEQLKGKIIQYLKGKTDEYLFPAQLVFWKYYSKTIFADDMWERMEAVFHSKRMRFMKNYARNPKHRQHASDLLEFGFGGMLSKSLFRAKKKK